MILACIFVMVFALVGVRVIGLQPFAVLSGSMEPTYQTGSIVYVKKVDYRTLKENDPITFLLDEKTVVTHRIVEVIEDPEEAGTIQYRTKGDNNDAEDGGSVHYKNVIGMPVFNIPYLGYVSNYIQNPPGNYIVISVCAILIILTFLPDLVKEDEKDNKAEKSVINQYRKEKEDEKE